MIHECMNSNIGCGDSSKICFKFFQTLKVFQTNQTIIVDLNCVNVPLSPTSLIRTTSMYTLSYPLPTCTPPHSLVVYLINVILKLKALFHGMYGPFFPQIISDYPSLYRCVDASQYDFVFYMTIFNSPLIHTQ